MHRFAWNLISKRDEAFSFLRSCFVRADGLPKSHIVSSILPMESRLLVGKSSKVNLSPTAFTPKNLLVVLSNWDGSRLIVLLFM